MKIAINSQNEIKSKPCPSFREFVIIENPIENLSGKKHAINGYGRCRSCDCSGYISKHDGSHTCKVCGHHYDRHRD